MPNTRIIDFEIIKEPWCKYQISDGSVLKVRTILTKVQRTMKNNVPEFRVDAHPLTVVNPDPDLLGSPDAKIYTSDELARTIEKQDMRYDTISQEFNEYVLDDGTKIKIYTQVTNIARSRLHNAKGEPIYNIETSNQVEIKLSSQYESPTD